MSVSGLVLAHGAGSDRDQATLVAVDQAVQPLPVHRFDFWYRREQRRRPPDRAPKLLACLDEERLAFCHDRELDPQRLVLGGHSMGGRMASMAVADGTPAAGLVLLSYPLHPQGKPDKLRVDHFDRIHVPVLFVSGDRDPLGRPHEFAEHIDAIAAPVTQVWIEGANHGPKPKHVPQIVEAVVTFMAGL